MEQGQVVRAERPGTYYPDAVSTLELSRPGHLPSREKCVFAADSGAAATAFLRAQVAAHEGIRLYEVEMPHFHKAPFRIVHELHKRMKASRNVDALVREYWSPKERWKFFEYFGPSFTVVKKVPTPAEMDVILFEYAYMADSDLSEAIQ